MPAWRNQRVAGRFTTVRLTVLLLLSGLVLTGAPAALVEAQTPPPTAGSVRDPYAPFVTEAAQRFGIPEAWIYAVMRIESRGDARAISPKGAMGLMQIMPATWTVLRARYGLGSDPYDPRDNILAGAAYLREMHDRYGAPGFLAAYNAGPGRYEAYRATGRPLPAETVTYVAMIAPRIGAQGRIAPVAVAAPAPLAWMRAPLFVARTGSSPVADDEQNFSASMASTTPSTAREIAPVETVSSGLFVRQADGARGQ